MSVGNNAFLHASVGRSAELWQEPYMESSFACMVLPLHSDLGVDAMTPSELDACIRNMCAHGVHSQLPLQLQLLRHVM